MQFLLGAHISVQLGLVFKQILLFIALPLVAGQLTRFWLLKKSRAETFRKEVAPISPCFSTLDVLGVVFVAMALKAQDLAESPTFLLQIIIATVVLYLLNYFISTIVARRFLNYADGVALVFGSTGTQAAILIAIAYTIQVQSAA